MVNKTHYYMKNLKSILTTLALVLCFSAAHAVTTVNPYEGITVGEFTEMSFKDFKKMSGQKLTVKHKLEFMVAKKTMKRAVKKGLIQPSDAAGSDFSINWGGLLLGFFLGLIGLLIVALAFKKPRKSAIISSLIGMGISLVLFFIL